MSPKKKNTMAEKRELHHQKAADKMIKMLQEGTAPWIKPWKPGEIPGGPVNAKTGKQYRGINYVHLMMNQPDDDPRYCTLKQANSLDAKIKKGEEGQLVMYWSKNRSELVRDDEGNPELDDEGNRQYKIIEFDVPRMYFATVYHASQIEGLPPLSAPAASAQQVTAEERHEECERLLHDSGAVIKHDQGDRAFYRYIQDTIHLPKPEQFDSMDAYYAVALHELGHWTGHKKRMDRDMQHPFGSEKYAKEELRAELASYMLGEQLGIGHDPRQHASYIASWIKTLKNDPKEVYLAAQEAQKMVNYVLDIGKELKHEKVAEAAVTVTASEDVEDVFDRIPVILHTEPTPEHQPAALTA